MENQFGKYSSSFLLQLASDLEDLLRYVAAKRDRAAFERTIKIIRKELGQ